MKNAAKHTPTPWRTTKTQPNVICNEGGDKWIARATIGHSKSPRFIADEDIAEANAEFIVLAVNNHHSLLGALKRALSKLEMHSPAHSATEIKLIRAAIAKAGGQA